LGVALILLWFAGFLFFARDLLGHGGNMHHVLLAI
jgi:hypothetical protein